MTARYDELHRMLMNKGRVERIKAEHQPKGLSAETVRNSNQGISSTMDFAVAQKIISENPCKAVVCGGVSPQASPWTPIPMSPHPADCTI